jgi:hypothetical protein
MGRSSVTVELKHKACLVTDLLRDLLHQNPKILIVRLCTFGAEFGANTYLLNLEFSTIFGY